HARQSTRERVFLTIDVTRQIARLLVLIATREFLDRKSLFQRLFTNAKITIITVAIDKFCMLMNFVRLVSELPRWRGKVDGIIDLRTGVAVLLRARRWLERDYAECQSNNSEKTKYQSQ